MRIALLTYSTRPRGGVVHTLALAEAFAAQGETVDVWSLARGGDDGFFRSVDLSVGLRLVPFHTVEDESVGARIMRSIATLHDAFDPTDYDIVHAQDCISANAVPNCVRTVHHLDTFTTPELIACHERAIVRPYAHVCVSAAVAGELADGWGIAATVIPNGVDSGRFEAGAADHTARIAWRKQLGAYVLAVGGIEPRKGTDDLVEAMALVRRSRPDLRLVIAGGETLFDYRPYRERVLTRAAELGVAPLLLGTVAEHDLPSLVAAADAFAFPSVQEGFGLAAMEALAAGTPVVTRNLPVLREVFRQTVDYASTAAGFASALLTAASRREPARVEDGRALAHGYSWAKSASAHRKFYAGLALRAS